MVERGEEEGVEGIEKKSQRYIIMSSGSGQE